MAIWQDLVDSHGFTASYQSVQRFVHKLEISVAPEARVVIETVPGEEAQVDYGSGPMVRDPHTGKYRRTRLFVFTLGYSRKCEDALFLGPGGTGKSHLAQAIGQAAILQGYKVLYREVHTLLDELSDTIADGTRKEYMASVATVPLLILDDFGMRKLPHTAAEDLLEIVMRRYERFSTVSAKQRWTAN
jgi:hypothetical protein